MVLDRICSTAATEGPDSSNISLNSPTLRLLASLYGRIYTVREGRGLYEKMQAWLASITDSKASLPTRV